MVAGAGRRGASGAGWYRPDLGGRVHVRGESVIRGCITKSGNRRARRILVEAAWSYRHPPRVGKEKQKKVEAVPRTVREIAWKAQTRLRGRFRKLTRKGKLSTTVTTAVARELSALSGQLT
jgi:hypothetical protein